MKACKEQGFDYSFHFFNRYAGQIYPKTATDAFCALHKGLDAADTKAYPEEKVGVIGIRSGKLGVIEYSDLGEEEWSPAARTGN